VASAGAPRTTTTGPASGRAARTWDQHAAAGSSGPAEVTDFRAGPVTRAAARRRAHLVAQQKAATTRPKDVTTSGAPAVVGVTTRAAAARLRLATTAGTDINDTGNHAEVATANIIGTAVPAMTLPLDGPTNVRGRSSRVRRPLSTGRGGRASSDGARRPSASSTLRSSACRNGAARDVLTAGDTPPLPCDPTPPKPSGSIASRSKEPRRRGADGPEEEPPRPAYPDLPPAVAARLMVVAAAHGRAAAAAAAVKTEAPQAGLGTEAPSSACGDATAAPTTGAAPTAVVKTEPPSSVSTADELHAPVAAEKSTPNPEADEQSPAHEVKMEHHPSAAAEVAADPAGDQVFIAVGGGAATAAVAAPSAPPAATLAAVAPAVVSVAPAGTQPVAPLTAAQRAGDGAPRWAGEGDTTAGGTGARRGRKKATPGRYPLA